MSRILVIDDDKSIRSILKEALEYEEHTVDTAVDGANGLELFEESEYDVVFLDIKMPKIDGIEVLDNLLKTNADIPVVMISGHGDINTAVECIKRGAYDYLPKPLDLNRLLLVIRNATDKSQLISETKSLKKKISKSFEMIGNSPTIEKVRQIIDRVAVTDAKILITGPNGCGKELVARQIHEKSNRSKQPFIEVNCAAIPSELIESELFGHEKGAFTSAHKQRKGKFEQADHGTIFLDEIGDMSLSAQAKVLRVLQEGKLARVGSDKEIKVDVRLIAATNKNLLEEIKANNFREDLYHRLSVILIEVPSLNQRIDDIPLLSDHFNRIICAEYGITEKIIMPDAIDELQKIHWTGNIREFRNVIERLIILCDISITGADVLAFAHPLMKS